MSIDDNKEHAADDAQHQLLTPKTNKALAATEQPSTANLQPLNPSMEVHHHSHGQHGKKKWTHYFWEFLMLFLAVFCGFLAEYQLEHKIEKDRGKQYIISFYKDLKYDTSHLTLVMNSYKNKIENLKTISICYDSILAKLSCKSCLNTLYNNSQGFFELRTSDRTMQQLKNAGGLRLLKSVDADSIIAYDNLIRGYKVDETTTFQETQTAVREISSELFNYAFVKDGIFTEGDLFIVDNKIIINKYFNTLNRYAKYAALYIQRLEKLKLEAVNIMNYFNKKYRFE